MTTVGTQCYVFGGTRVVFATDRPSDASRTISSPSKHPFPARLPSPVTARTGRPVFMGRRGRTGAGGAVVSSLSGNSGGTVAPKRKNGSRGGGGGGGGAADVDLGVDIVFETKASGKARAKKNAAANAAASAEPAGSSASARTNPVPQGESLSIPRASAGWLGKSPVEHLRDWCEKNNRKRP